MATTKTTSATKTKAVSSRKVTSATTADISSTESLLSMKISKRYVLVGLVVIAVAFLLYALRSFFIAATVNGQPISRIAVIQELEKQGGKQTMNSLITKTLIEQEAAKKNVTVSQKDIDDELKKIEVNLAKQGQTLDQVLQLQGMTRDTLTNQIKTQKLVEKLVGTITVTDKDIAAYMEANKASIPEGSNMTDVKKSAKEQLQQQKVSEKAQALLQKLQKEAKINYLVQY